MVYVIQVCWQLASRSRMRMEPSWSYSQAVSKPVWRIPLLCVQWKTPDNGQRNCPKHVELYSKNKFEKLVHLLGFIIRIYHDARSPERHIWKGDCVSSRDRTHWWRDSCMLTPGIEARFSISRTPQQSQYAYTARHLNCHASMSIFIRQVRILLVLLKTRG